MNAKHRWRGWPLSGLFFIVLGTKAKHVDPEAGGWASSGGPVFSVTEERRPRLKVMSRGRGQRVSEERQCAGVHSFP